MNGLSGAVSGLVRSNGGNGPNRGTGANSVGGENRSPVSSPVSLKAGRKRTQEAAGFESSPGSGDGEAEGTEERRRQPGVKRACNECRQQKVSQRVWQPRSHGTEHCIHSFDAMSFKSRRIRPVDGASV